MRALITGANGFVGSCLARRLAKRGDAVRCLVRKGSDASALSGVRCELVWGDVTVPSSLPAAMKDVDVVFHLAGIRRAPERDIFFTVNAEGTRNVCEAMRAADVPRLVLCGSLAAMGPSVEPHVETDAFSPSEPYGESKAEAERIAFSYSKWLEVAVARPPRITGPGDRENLAFFKLVKNGFKLKIAGPSRPLSTIDVEDAVDLLILLAERKEAVGEAFFATGPDQTSLEGIQDLAARAMGIKPFPLLLPATVLLGLSACADWASRRSGKHLPLNRKLARQLIAPGWTCSSEKAQKRLGYRPRHTVAESIARSAQWYLEKGWL
jgi:nucleoside-diphosphate-sugar epimerase